MARPTEATQAVVAPTGAGTWVTTFGDGSVWFVATSRVGTGPRVLAGLVVTALTGLFALGVGVSPAIARDDAGPAATVVGHAGECFLERVGTQLVRCDDLTGNGVPAPGYIPER